jgi:hypothetical protein
MFFKLVVHGGNTAGPSWRTGRLLSISVHLFGRAGAALRGRYAREIKFLWFLTSSHCSNYLFTGNDSMPVAHRHGGWQSEFLPPLKPCFVSE